MKEYTHTQVTLSKSDLEFVQKALEEYGDVTIPTDQQFTEIVDKVKSSAPAGTPENAVKDLIRKVREVFDNAVAEVTIKRDRSILIRAQLTQAKLNPQEFGVLLEATG